MRQFNCIVIAGIAGGNPFYGVDDNDDVVVVVAGSRLPYIFMTVPLPIATMNDSLAMYASHI